MEGHDSIRYRWVVKSLLFEMQICDPVPTHCHSSNEFRELAKNAKWQRHLSVTPNSDE